MLRTPPAALVLLCALAGCASLPPPYPVDAAGRQLAYQAARPCCDDAAAFDFVDLPASGSIEVVVGAASPAFEFHSGLSPFAAFRLPPGERPYRVRVKSLFEAADGSVFYPVMAMLDEGYIVTRLSNLESLQLDQALAVPGGESGLAVTAPFDPAYARERYLVVFTPAVLLGAAPSSRREGDVVTLPTLQWLERRGAGLVEPSPYGRLQLTVAPDPLPTPGRGDRG